MLEQTGYINISGIGSGVGRTRTATRYPIEQLYTRLRSRGVETLDRESSDLAELLPRHNRLLIEGQPGAGKTTLSRSHAPETVKVFCSIVIKYAKQRIKENFHLTL